MKKYFLLLDCLLFLFSSLQAQYLEPFKDANGKYGFKNKSGKIVVPAKYDIVGYEMQEDFNKGFISVKLNGKWGFIDSTGKEVAAPKYEEVGFFREGRAEVKKDGKYGLINTAGKEVVPVKYQRINIGFSAFVAVQQNDKWGFVNKAGKEIAAPKYQNVHNFYQNLAAVQLNGKWGFIDTTGKEIIAPQYDEIRHDFMEYGKARVKKDGQSFNIDNPLLNATPKPKDVNIKTETKPKDAQTKTEVSPVIPPSSIILPANIPKTPVVMNGGIDESIPGLWTATYPNGMKVYFEFKKDGMYVFYTGDYTPGSAYNQKCYWRVDGAFMETLCAGATKVDRSRYIKGYDTANKPTLKIGETIFFPADKKMSW